jgi:hypothetical protein
MMVRMISGTSSKGEKWNGEVCGTPFSQTSTAPCTPSHFHLLDPPDVPPMFIGLADDSRTTTGATTPQDSAIFHVPPLKQLKSELAKWAHELVEKEYATRTQQEPVLSIGMPPLSSDLGKWAQKQIEAEKWLKGQIQLSDQEAVKNYLVDNSVLRTGTCGLAYRKSKRVGDIDMDVPGPAWGSIVAGSTKGDGWLKVENHYLPMVLQGMSVVSASPKDCVIVDVDHESELEASIDGPAFTQDGRVVDLDEGMPIFFSFDKELSSGHSSKQIMKNAMKAFQKADLARLAEEAASDVMSEAVCSIGPDGEVRGAAAMSPSQEAKQASAVAAKRMKKFHRKQRCRQWCKTAPDVFTVDASGKVLIFLYLPRNLPRRHCEPPSTGPMAVMSIDSNGIIRDFPCPED